MSEEEKHAIAGKMMADYVQAKSDLVALNQKANGYATVLKRIGESLATRSDPHDARTLSGAAWDEVLKTYPRAEDISSLAEEIVTVEQRKNKLFSDLRGMGFELKN